MADKPSADELAERLRQAEEIIETLRSFKVDAIVGANQIGMLRLKEVEDQLAEQATISANRMAEIESIYQSVPVGLCVLDRELRYKRINRHLATINGIPEEEHLGRSVREVLPQVADIVEEDVRRVIDTGEPRMNVELSGETPAQPGVQRHWLSHWLPLLDERGQVARVSVVVEEITERKQHEETLQKLNATLEERVAERTRIAEQRAARLREMAMEMGRVEEMERRRLARLLHDGLQQLLVAAKYSVGLIRGRLIDRDDVREPFDQLDRILDQSIDASCSLSYDLSPPILHDRGLGPALSWLAGQLHHQHGLTVDFRSEGEIPDMSQGLKVFLFHTVRELLFNVVKHADADRAEVDLSAQERNICIEVRDRGRGFEIAKIDFEAPVGLGLKGFRKKLDLVNGKMKIDSQPGRGTRVFLRVPSDVDSAEIGGAEASPEVPEDATPRVVKERPPSAPARGGKTRVFVVDDHWVVRSGLVSLLEEKSDIEIVGEAGDGIEAIAAVRRDPPDVVVMDLSMPKMDGIRATRRIRQEFPNVRVLGLTMHEESEFCTQMKEAGATDLLSKGGPADLLIAAIRGARD